MRSQQSVTAHQLAAGHHHALEQSQVGGGDGQSEWQIDTVRQTDERTDGRVRVACSQLISER